MFDGEFKRFVSALEVACRPKINYNPPVSAGYDEALPVRPDRDCGGFIPAANASKGFG
ncbi:MAG: hypothetical protein ABI454_00975 [Sphingomicrobium sp.]